MARNQCVLVRQQWQWMPQHIFIRICWLRVIASITSQFWKFATIGELVKAHHDIVAMGICRRSQAGPPNRRARAATAGLTLTVRTRVLTNGKDRVTAERVSESVGNRVVLVFSKDYNFNQRCRANDFRIDCRLFMMLNGTATEKTPLAFIYGGKEMRGNCILVKRSNEAIRSMLAGPWGALIGMRNRRITEYFQAAPTPEASYVQHAYLWHALHHVAVNTATATSCVKHVRHIYVHHAVQRMCIIHLHVYARLNSMTGEGAVRPGSADSRCIVHAACMLASRLAS
jgi:hypothetical protein